MWSGEAIFKFAQKKEIIIEIYLCFLGSKSTNKNANTNNIDNRNYHMRRFNGIFSQKYFSYL